MASPVLYTGSDCDLSVGGSSYKDVVASFELAFTTEAAEYNTLGGNWALPGSESGTLSVTFAYDTGNTNSLFTALWTAASDGSNVSFVATDGNTTFTGEAVASRPGVNAVAGQVSEVTVQMTLNGIPTPSTSEPAEVSSKSK